MIEGERRRDDKRWYEITQDISQLKAQHGEIRLAVDQNTQITNEIKTNTEEIIEFFKAGKGFFTSIGYIAKFAKWLTAIAAAVGVAWTAFHIGKDS